MQTFHIAGYHSDTQDRNRKDLVGARLLSSYGHTSLISTMCYHNLYLFDCGHTVTSAAPVTRAPPCPRLTNELFDRPSMASPVDLQPSSHATWTQSSLDPSNRRCSELLSHPLHTFRVEKLCLTCSRGREERVARFEVEAIRKDVTRSFARLRAKQEKQIGRVRKTLRAGYTPGKATQNEAGIMEMLVEGVKDLVGWEEDRLPHGTGTVRPSEEMV